jgi:ornithine carbamoyltransferase
LTLQDYKREEILEIIDLAKEIKRDLKSGVSNSEMKNRTLGMIFEKSSTRTRVSFEVGIYQLGGVGLFLSNRDIQLGRGEPMKDTARVISRMVDMVMIRTFSQSKLEEFAKYSKVPVINGLTDEFHPVQLLADYLTITEYNIEKPKVAYVGDGNNMAHSWLMLASKLGFDLNIATPKGYEVDSSILEYALAQAKESGATISVGNSKIEAIRGCNVVTTDTWISMGEEKDNNRILEDFRDFKVDKEAMSYAQKGAIFLHCLPAYREKEVSEEVFEEHSDVIFDEAENRLHAQKGLMVWLNRKREA